MFDETYVLEILAAAARGLSATEFDRHCLPDMRAGYNAEVAEAKRRYFSQKD